MSENGIRDITKEEMKAIDANVDHKAYQENVHNKKHVKVTHGGGITTMYVDSKSVTYNGVKAAQLSDEYKKKLENRLLFLFLPTLRQVPKIVYR
jgi:hypothetical protein